MTKINNYLDNPLHAGEILKNDMLAYYILKFPSWSHLVTISFWNPSDIYSIKEKSAHFVLLFILAYAGLCPTGRDRGIQFTKKLKVNCRSTQLTGSQVTSNGKNGRRWILYKTFSDIKSRISPRIFFQSKPGELHGESRKPNYIKICWEL